MATDCSVTILTNNHMGSFDGDIRENVNQNIAKYFETVNKNSHRFLGGCPLNIWRMILTEDEGLEPPSSFTHGGFQVRCLTN